MYKARKGEILKCFILDAEMQAALPIMESLRKQGFHVTAGSYKRINMGFCSRFPNRRIIYPSPEGFPEAFFERILELVKKHQFTLTLPIDDFSSEILSKYKDILSAYTYIPVVDYKTFMMGRDKSLTMKIAREYGIPCPQTFFPHEEKIEHIAKRAKFPVLVKANISSGARGISLVKKSADLDGAYKKIKEDYGECHIQEFIPKGGLQYKADLFLDQNQELKAGIVYSKLRFFPINGGSSVFNCTVNRPDIIESARKILKAIGWYGFADFDFIVDPRDGIAKLMEINPRMPNTLRISSAAGIDFTSMIVKLALGENIPRISSYKSDIYLRYFFLDVLWFIKSGDRFKAHPKFFKLFGKNLYDQIVSLNDPGPILGFCLENMLAAFNGASRKARYTRGW